MTASETARLFLALWPDDGVRAAIAAHRDTWPWPAKAAPMRPEKLHLTLHFLGDVPRDRLPELRDALRIPLTPFTLHLGEPECWPHGIAVLRPLDAPPPLIALRNALADVLHRLDLPVEARPYRPHITLARRAFDTPPPAPPGPIEWPVHDYVLVESEPDARRTYTVLARYG